MPTGSSLTESPEAVVADLEAQARRVETPCGDGRLVWRIWGQGPPVVLGHGAQGSWAHWIRNIDALAKTRTVIAVDLPGHGDSADPVSPDHAGISAALAIGLRHILGAETAADLVGFSFGGVVFAYLAASHPALIRRLILIGCGGLDTPHGHVNLRRISGLRGEERRAALKANLLGLMLHHPDSADDLAIHLLVTMPRSKTLNPQALVMPDRLAAILPKVAAPVDAIWGEFDRPHPGPALQAAVIRRSHPDADFRVIGNAGHWAMYECPDAFNATLIDMLVSEPRRMPC